ncbi:hypothetical protein RRG08_035822 [Elysia crispata]|uniref:Uncharacterized protein n=1 Tax=Elysia crispata TaxID=231223 RepID=A0AAE1AJ93_9GAST|nr:hypothetical protein RRG08_035822 [Elysia crispata]
MPASGSTFSPSQLSGTSTPMGGAFGNITAQAISTAHSLRCRAGELNILNQLVLWHVCGNVKIIYFAQQAKNWFFPDIRCGFQCVDDKNPLPSSLNDKKFQPRVRSSRHHP